MMNMTKTVSHKVIAHSYNKVLDAGMDDSFIYHETGISKSDVAGEHGRLNITCVSSMYELCRVNKIALIEPDIWDLSLENIMAFSGDLFSLCLTSATAREAILNFINYRAIIGEYDYILLKQDSQNTYIHYIPNISTPWASLDACGTFVLIYKILQYFCENHRPRCNMRFTGDSWIRQLEYCDFFHGDMKFNEPVNCMIFDTRILNEVNNEHNLLVSKYLKNKLQEEISRTCYLYDDNNSLSKEEQLQSLIYKVWMDNDMCDLRIEHISEKLGMSRWTIRRKLMEEGTNYQQLTTIFRREKAIEQLSQKNIKIGDIGESLGFSSHSSFTRFFIKNFNMSPVEYKEALTSLKTKK